MRYPTTFYVMWAMVSMLFAPWKDLGLLKYMEYILTYENIVWYGHLLVELLSLSSNADMLLPSEATFM
jgi:hypothetical protein